MRKRRLELERARGRENCQRFLVDLSAAAEIREALSGDVSDRRARLDLVRDLQCRAGVPGPGFYARRVPGEESRYPLGSAAGCRGVVHAARDRRLRTELLSQLGRKTGHQGTAARCVLALFAAAYGLSGSTTVRALALKTDQQHRAGGGGGDRRGDFPHKRQLEHSRAAGNVVLHELAPGGIL